MMAFFLTMPINNNMPFVAIAVRSLSNNLSVFFDFYKSMRGRVNHTNGIGSQLAQNSQSNRRLTIQIGVGPDRLHTVLNGSNIPQLHGNPLATGDDQLSKLGHIAQ